MRRIFIPGARQREHDLAAAELRPLAAYAGERGVRLALEPLNRFETDLINVVEQGLALVEAVGSPHIGLHLDTFHMRLRGRCSACGVHISPRYPLVELGTGLLFAAVAWRLSGQPAALLYCGMVAALVALTMIDWDTTVLPDVITLPLMWAGLLAAALGWLPGLTLAASLWGAIAGYLSLWSVYWLFKLTTGKEGMGFGDFKLLAALGAWLSWQAILPIVLMASMLGAAVGLLMKFKGSLREGRFVPFGPFLARLCMLPFLADSLSGAK